MHLRAEVEKEDELMHKAEVEELAQIQASKAEEQSMSSDDEGRWIEAPADVKEAKMTECYSLYAPPTNVVHRHAPFW